MADAECIGFGYRSSYLGSNGVEQDGCEALTKGNWPELTQLSLGYNGIDNDGCKSLSKGKWTTLKSLMLWGN